MSSEAKKEDTPLEAKLSPSTGESTSAAERAQPLTSGGATKAKGEARATALARAFARAVRLEDADDSAVKSNSEGEPRYAMASHPCLDPEWKASPSTERKERPRPGIAMTDAAIARYEAATRRQREEDAMWEEIWAERAQNSGDGDRFS